MAYRKGPLAAGMSTTVYVELRAAAERSGLDLRAVGAALRIATEVEIYSVPISGVVGAPLMAMPYALSGLSDPATEVRARADAAARLHRPVL